MYEGSLRFVNATYNESVHASDRFKNQASAFLKDGICFGESVSVCPFNVSVSQVREGSVIVEFEVLEQRTQAVERKTSEDFLKGIHSIVNATIHHREFSNSLGGRNWELSFFVRTPGPTFTPTMLPTDAAEIDERLAEVTGPLREPVNLALVIVSCIVTMYLVLWMCLKFSSPRRDGDPSFVDRSKSARLSRGRKPNSVVTTRPPRDTYIVNYDEAELHAGFINVTLCLIGISVIGTMI